MVSIVKLAVIMLFNNTCNVKGIVKVSFINMNLSFVDKSLLIFVGALLT